MNWLDIVIIVLLAGSVVGGLITGIIRILFTLVGGILGVVLAGQFGDKLGGKLTFISNTGTANMGGFVFILVVVIIIFMIVGLLIKKIATKLPFAGWIDKLGGAILGLVMGAISIGAILTMVSMYHGVGDTITGSKLATFFVDKFPLVLGLLPSSFKDVKNFFP